MLLQFAGLVLLVLFGLNAFLPRWLDWKADLPRMSLVNARVMRSHAIFIALVVLAMAWLCLGYAHDLMRPTRLSRALLAGLAGFWFLRLLAQWFLYDWSLWRGHRGRTAVQFVATTLWAAITAAFAYAWWANVNG